MKTRSMGACLATALVCAADALAIVASSATPTLVSIAVVCGWDADATAAPTATEAATSDDASADAAATPADRSGAQKSYRSAW